MVVLILKNDQEYLLAVPKIIAIDGPAASGKSTLAKRLAEHLDYLYFDTGVMYRAVTWIVIQRGVAFDDETRVTDLAESVPIDVRSASKNDGRDYDVLVEGQDITWDIRRPEVEANVSVVSAYPGVRKALSAQQRRVGLRGSVVMVGRDIGTVVLPEAGLKIYLDASVEERARRRYEERSVRGNHVSCDTILKAMRKRDQIDSTRDVAPLRIASDAVVIDSDGKDIDAVFAETKALVSG
jgi:cytidylate kinase